MIATKTKTNPNNPLDKFLQTAIAAGCPPDQLLLFRAGNYAALPKQLSFSAAARECDEPGGPTQVGFGGARGPGKSHGAFAQVCLDDCQRKPGLKALYLRKIGKNAREQFEDLRRAVLRGVPHRYNRSEGVVYFPNGSRIIIGHFNSESDVDNYLGIAYDVMLVEEATSLTLTKYRAIRDSNRSALPGWRPRIYATTNPGGVGHAWFKSTFITPAREGRESDTRFIFATVEDNPHLDSGYRRKLEENTGWRLRAYRYGDWDIAAGQFFTPFRHDVHVIKPLFGRIPKGWPVWGSLDYGYIHPTVYYLHTIHDDVIYTVAEYWRQRAKVQQNAPAIKEIWQRWGVRPRLNVAGHDIFGEEDDAPTIADRYKAEGIKFEPASVNRVNGWGEILDRLGDPDSPNNPIAARWYIFEGCTHLAECIPSLEHNPNRPEDVLKVDVDENGQGGDDPGDCARYGLMVRRKSPLAGVLAQGSAKGWAA